MYKKPVKNTCQNALFLDRDGVINYDFGYVHSKKNFDFIPGIFKLVSTAQDRGYKVIIVTNQSGIGRGYYSDDDFWKLMNWVKDVFKQNKGHIDDIYYCPDKPSKNQNTISFRKPNPGMILKAAIDHDLCLKKCLLVGDNLSDIEAGKSAGVGHNILFQPKGLVDVDQNHSCVNNLLQIINYI